MVNTYEHLIVKLYLKEIVLSTQATSKLNLWTVSLWNSPVTYRKHTHTVNPEGWLPSSQTPTVELTTVPLPSIIVYLPGNSQASQAWTRARLCPLHASLCEMGGGGGLSGHPLQSTQESPLGGRTLWWLVDVWSVVITLEFYSNPQIIVSSICWIILFKFWLKSSEV